MTVRRAATYSVNTLLVLVIIGVILATWLPAIYVSPWFQNNRWVQAHLIGQPVTPPAVAPPARPGRR
jgi:hypothetical protein